MSVKPERNDPCPCGSGKKYKKCCLEKDEAATSRRARAYQPGPPFAPDAGDPKWMQVRKAAETLEFKIVGWLSRKFGPDALGEAGCEFLDTDECNLREFFDDGMWPYFIA